MRNLLLALGTILPLVATTVYIVSIVRGRSKPHWTTRILFTLIGGLSFAALVAGGDRSGVWLAFSSLLQAIILLGLTVRYGVGGKDTFDLICCGCCLLGVAAWMLTGESLAGLIASIATDLLAILPTLRKIWHQPHTESWVFYALDVPACAAIVLAGPYGWRELLFPVYLLLINLACACLILARLPAVRDRIPSNL